MVFLSSSLLREKYQITVSTVPTIPLQGRMAYHLETTERPAAIPGR